MVKLLKRSKPDSISELRINIERIENEIFGKIDKLIAGLNKQNINPKEKTNKIKILENSKIAVRVFFLHLTNWIKNFDSADLIKVINMAQSCESLLGNLDLDQQKEKIKKIRETLEKNK